MQRCVFTIAFRPIMKRVFCWHRLLSSKLMFIAWLREIVFNIIQYVAVGVKQNF